MFLFTVLSASILVAIIADAAGYDERKDILLLYEQRTMNGHKSMLQAYQELLDRYHRTKQQLEYQSLYQNIKPKQITRKTPLYMDSTFDKFVSYCRSKALLSTFQSTNCYKCKCIQDKAYQCKYQDQHICKFNDVHRGSGETFRNGNGCLLCRGLTDVKSICMRMRRCVSKPPKARRERDKIILDAFLNNLGFEQPDKEVQENNKYPEHPERPQIEADTITSDEDIETSSKVKCNVSEVILNRQYPYVGKCTFAACNRHDWLVRVSNKDCPDFPISNAWCEDSDNFAITLHRDCFTCHCIPKVKVLACQRRIVGDNWGEGSVCRTTFTLANPEDIMTYREIATIL